MKNALGPAVRSAASALLAVVIVGCAFSVEAKPRCEVDPKGSRNRFFV